jgi:hypothetical protein
MGDHRPQAGGQRDKPRRIGTDLAGFGKANRQTLGARVPGAPVSPRNMISTMRLPTFTSDYFILLLVRSGALSCLVETN